MSSKALQILMSTHPIPSIAVATFAMLFSVGVGLDTTRVLLVGLSVLLQQFSVGLSNDWLDAERDAAAKRKNKPTVTAKLSQQILRNWSFVAAALAILTALLLSNAAAAWMIPMLIVGWAYNLGMKANWSSVIPYAVGFGMLPVFVTLSDAEPGFPPVWVIIAASLLGISAHFANVLPDLIADKNTGVRALPHILGQGVSAVVIAVTATAASAVIVTQSPALPLLLGWLGLGVTAALAGSASSMALRPEPPRMVFPLLIIASLVNVVMLMLGIA